LGILTTINSVTRKKIHTLAVSQKTTDSATVANLPVEKVTVFKFTPNGLARIKELFPILQTKRRVAALKAHNAKVNQTFLSKEECSSEIQDENGSSKTTDTEAEGDSEVPKELNKSEQYMNSEQQAAKSAWTEFTLAMDDFTAVLMQVSGAVINLHPAKNNCGPLPSEICVLSRSTVLTGLSETKKYLRMLSKYA